MIDVIIPIYQLDKYRKESLKKHIETGANIVAVEQDVSVWNEFNKGWLQNIGVNMAARGFRQPSDYVAIVDVDVVPWSGYYEGAINWMKYNHLKWCFGWSRLMYEGKNGTKLERDDWPSPGLQEGGIVIFTRAMWDSMGGANEHIRELRGCDNDLALRATYASGTRSCYPVTLTHRWHPHSPMKKTKWKKNNVGIIDYTLHHPQEIVDLLKDQARGNTAGPYCKYKSFFEWRTQP